MLGKVVKLFCPAGVFIAAPIFIPELHAKESIACHECHMKRLPKAHELPLYDTFSEKEVFLVERPKSSLEEAIRLTRKSTEKYIVALDGARKRTVEIYDTGIAHSKNTYEYITEDANVVPRTIAIASGGLVGLLLSIKGGIFRKVLYSSSGIAIVASACYPLQAKEYVHRGFVVTKENARTLLNDYGGYDIDKTTVSVQEKFSQLKNVVKLDDLAKSIKSYFSKTQSFDTTAEQVPNKSYGDPGQSNPKDSDMYTTRK